MLRKTGIFCAALLACAAAQAATTNTTLTVNATLAIGTSVTATGTATLTGIGNGTFNGTLPVTAIGQTTATADFTIALASGGTLTGKLTIPVALLFGGTSGSGSATITGGTGTYAGATGTFATLTGTANGLNVTFTGAGSITTGETGGPGPGTPTTTITDVLDAGSYTKGIAQGSVFVVKGSNLAPSGLKQYTFPLPATSDGVKITFTPAAGGSGVDAFLVYTCNTDVYGCVGEKTQLAAVLPSTLPVGNYNVTVTNGTSVSAPFVVSVVQRKPGLITQSSDGSGLASVQNFISQGRVDLDRFTTGSVGGTTISPARPGQVLIAWGTGLGPVTGGDNTASPGFDFAANGVTVRVLVGGTTITPLYAGRAPGLAGADQINFELPANVPTGCTVSFQISVNGVLSNPAFIAIAPNASAGACVSDSFSADQLRKFDQGGTYTTGTFNMSQVSTTIPGTGTFKSNLISGGFAQFNGFKLDSASAAQPTQTGACFVSRYVSTDQSQNGATATVNFLDAGAITLNGPAASGIANVALPRDAKYGTYYLSLGTEGLPISLPGQVNATLVAGTYTLAGAGGMDVGRFNASVTLGSPLNITGGLPATVNRSSGLTLNWTGGNASDIVQISGSGTTVTGSSPNQVYNTTSFYCSTTAGAGSFTVPSSVLSQLPAVASSSTTSSGSLQVVSYVNPTGTNGLFSAPLTAGGSIDAGFFLALTGFAGTATYQ